MSAVRRLRCARLLLIALAVAVTAPILAVPGVAAAAPASSGETVVGQLVQAWPEYRDHDEATDRGADGPLSFVRTKAGESVRVDTDDVDDLPLGATVEVTVGRAISDEAATEDGYERARDVLDTEVLAPPPGAPTTTSPAVTPVDHPVSVVMVVPAGGTRDSTTLADVVNTVNGPVADFWAQETDGAIHFGVTAQKDWVELSVGCDDPYALWDAAAKVVGFTRGQKKHLLVYVSSTPGNLEGCSDGLGEVGWSKDTGGYSYVRGAMPSIIAHELGHNLSLGHSSLKQCDGAVNTGPCEVTPYLDMYDVMGFSWEQLGSLSLAQAALLIPIPQTQAFDPQSPATTVTLAPVSQRSGRRGIALRSDLWTRYWVEYRPPTGRDAWLGTSDNWPGLQSGVLIRQTGASNDTALLLDGTPSPEAGWPGDLDVAFPLNTPVRVDDLPGKNGAFFLTVTSVSPTEATLEVLPKTAITLRYEASGGVAGPLGAPTAAESCGGTNWITHCSRSFANGIVMWDYGMPGRLIYGDIYQAWVAGGGSSLQMGAPSGDPVCGLAQGGCLQKFVHADIAWSPGTGAFALRKAARYWYENGAQAGLLGYPTGDQTCVAESCEQPFQGGTVVVDPALGTVAVQGPLRDAWVAAGGRSGFLGLPTAPMSCGLVRGGCAQQFQGGSMYWSAGSGAHGVSARTMNPYAAQNRERGDLGYPTAAEVCGSTDGGCKQAFEGGTVQWSPRTGARAVVGPIAAAWVAAGAEAGAVGYPTSPQFCGLKESGCVQAFQGGRIYTTPGTGAHPLTGAIHDAWAAQGYERGPLGYATGDQVCGLAGGGCKQTFQGGTLISHPTAGTRQVTGAIATAWTAAGAEAGALGYPTSPQYCGLKESGCVQAFQAGRIYTTPGTGTHPLTGPIHTAWEQQGYERGPLGYPTSDPYAVAGGTAQNFQGGTLTHDSGTGQVTRS